MSRIFYSDLRKLTLSIGTGIIMNRLLAATLIVLLFLQKAGLFFTLTQSEKDDFDDFQWVLFQLFIQDTFQKGFFRLLNILFVVS